MKYQSNKLRHLLSVGLATSFLFGAAMAETYNEDKQYDSINDKASGLIKIPTNNDTQIINGVMNRANDVDLWGFEASRATRAIYVFNNSNFSVLWSFDKNKNHRSDPSDRNITLLEGKEGRTFMVRNAPQILAIVSGPANQKYQLHVRNESKPKREITATIISAKALDKFDGRFAGGADFRASVRHAKPEKHFTGITARKDTVGNNNNPTYKNLSVTVTYSVSSRKIPIVLSLVDVDPGTKDEKADISPKTGKRTLELQYDMFLKTVIGPSGEKLGKAGQVITVQGTEKRRARISFRIDQKDPIVVR